jgi:HAE1 family hydrophobic/amphiphilic exporter-1
VTIAIAVLISGFISLSLTPMLCSLFLRPEMGRKHGRIYMISERFFQRLLNAYERSLKWVLKHRLATLITLFIFLAATVYLYIVIPKGFLPSEDTGRVIGATEAAQGISFESMAKHQMKVAGIVKNDPNVDIVMASIGVSGSNVSPNAGNMLIRLKPRNERQLSADQFIQELRPKLAAVPGIRVYLQNPPPIVVGGVQTRSQYQFSLQSPDIEPLYKYAPLLEAKIRQLPGFQDVTSNLQIKNPQAMINIDRNKASAVGLSAGQIENALQSAYSSYQISTIYAPNNEYQVIIEIDPKYSRDPSALSLLYVRSTSGSLVPLNTVANVDWTVGPVTVNHLGQFPSVTISFNLAPGKSLGDAVNDVQKAAQGIVPSTITSSLQGTAQAFASSMTGFGILILVAILVIYIVLGILYESFVHPITILSGLPPAGLGALITLMIFHIDLNLYALVGVLMLIGIVKKNAIMMIDFALEAERKEGKKPEEAIYEGAVIRFRPIMMTTMSALMATLPIALGLGGGAESRRPLGLAVVGGLIFSQTVTLYMTPVIYIYLDKLQAYMKRVFARFHYS